MQVRNMLLDFYKQLETYINSSGITMMKRTAKIFADCTTTKLPTDPKLYETSK